MAHETHGDPAPCLEDEAIGQFLADSLPAAIRDRAAEHLVECQRCREKMRERASLGAHETQNYSSVILDETGTAFSLPSISADELLAPGTSLGRYVVLAKVGAGGMGVVYSAFDPELERQIAVKVIRTEVLSDMERAHTNLRQEARAMAQLTHPNVVRVYDVGTQGELVYIAMEFVEGEDLQHFAERQQEAGNWRTIFEACMDAGRGLQAAHNAGLVHRDFKPSNVLVAEDGRVLVADFGLTRLFSKTEDGGSVGWTSASGTPGYCAPEQLAGEGSDARSDQYSFCVTVAQCLFGRDPMTRFARLEREQSDALKTPRRLAPLVQRGLATKASERHESMDELLEALAAAGRPRHRAALAAGSVGVLAGVAGLMFVLGGRVSHAADICAGGAERFDALWGQQRHEKLDLLLTKTKYTRQATFFLQTASALSQNLVAEQRQSCQATFHDKTQSTELFDRQMFCLNSQATELDAIISMVEDGASVEVGQSSLGGFPSVAECRITESLLATKPPPSDAESLAKIQAVEDLLAERRALEAARKPQEALAKVEAAIALAREVGYGPLITRAESQSSQLLETLERFGDAKQAAERARDAASKARDTRRMIIALLQLASIVNTHEDDADEAKAYLAMARSLSLGIELPVIDKVEIEVTSGTLAQTNGDHEGALGHAKDGLELLEALDQNESEVQGAKIMLLQIFASAHFGKSELDKAAPLLRTIHELKEKRLGPEHSQLAVSLTNIATVDYQLGKYEGALSTLARARELLRSPDASQADLGQALSLEALIQNRLGRLPEAVALYKETIEVYTGLFGADHANIWRTKANLANTLMALERWEETLEIQRGFAAWAAERYGYDSPTAVAARLNFASTNVQAHYEDGEVAEGQRLLSTLAAELPKEDPTQVSIVLMQGNAFLALKEHAKAAASFESALKLNAKFPKPEPSFVATTTGSLADALWQAGKKKRALATGQQALELYQELGPAAEEYRKQQAEWIEAKSKQL